MNKSNNGNGENLPVKRARVSSVVLYDVKEEELQILEKGSEATIHLIFSIFFLSSALNSLGVLLSVNLLPGVTKGVFILILILGVVIGLYLLLLWQASKKSITNVANTIRSRLELDPSVSASEPEE